VKSQRSGVSNTKPEREIDCLKKYRNTGRHKCVLCTETENIPDYTHKCVLCTETENIPDYTHKCVLCTEPEHIPDGTAEMCTVHRNRTHSKRYIRNVYCAQKQNTFQTVHQNVYCAQKQNTFQTVHKKCVLCTETEHIPDGT
jgi:hypothetical protein